MRRARRQARGVLARWRWLVIAAIAAFVGLTLLTHHGGGPSTEYGFVGPTSAPTVKVRSDRLYVTFTNNDGSWTLLRRCQGTDVAGVGYIGRIVSRLGWVVSNDIGEGGFAELNSPAHGGAGTFGLELHRGNAAPSWNDTQHLSMRRCGPWGATSWTAPVFGIGPRAGFYDQDVWLGDDVFPRLVRVRVRYRIDPDDVRLYMGVDVCPNGCPSSYYAKEPKLAVVANGQGSSERWNHITTYDGDGQPVAEPGHNRECSYRGRDAFRETGHCFDEERERVRLDFASHDCSPTTPCFNVVARALPAGKASLLAGPVTDWEAPGGHGLDRWAVDAAAAPKLGDAGCVTIDGQPVFSPYAENARNWEYAVFGGPDGYEGVDLMLKSYDGCRNSLDAPALFRQLEPGHYGAFLSFSLGDGWRRN